MHNTHWAYVKLPHSGWQRKVRNGMMPVPPGVLLEGPAIAGPSRTCSRLAAPSEDARGEGAKATQEAGAAQGGGYSRPAWDAGHRGRQSAHATVAHAAVTALVLLLGELRGRAAVRIDFGSGGRAGALVGGVQDAVLVVVQDGLLRRTADCVNGSSGRRAFAAV